MASGKRVAGSEKLPYHQLIRNIPKEYIDSTLWERPETVVVGLFSHTKEGKQNPEEEQEVLDQGTQELSSKTDIRKCMKDIWQTSALVNLDYSKLKKFYQDVEDQVTMELRFEDPTNFYRKSLRERVRKGEELLDEEQQGLSKLLNSLKILEKLVEFIDDHAQKFNQLVESKSYNGLTDLLIDVLSQDWGKKFYRYLENENIEL